MSNALLFISGIFSIFIFIVVIIGATEYTKNKKEEDELRIEIAKISEFMFKNWEHNSAEKILFAMKRRDKDVERMVRQIEDATYNLLQSKDRPRLRFSDVLKDITRHRIYANKYKWIKPEYETLVKDKKFIDDAKNNIDNLNKRLHVKNQTIYELRKRYGVKAPSRKRKKLDKNI